MTRREEIINILIQQDMSIKELADMFNIESKEIVEDLEHIKKSTRKKHKFKVTPARCRMCGFTFVSREKIKKPSKCPKCDNELIEEARFRIV